MARPCECSDSDCSAHKGNNRCRVDSVTVVYRSDMADIGGTHMCEACSIDALTTGLFYEDDDDTTCADCTLDGCDGTGEECPCNYECHGGPIESATDDEGE